MRQLTLKKKFISLWHLSFRDVSFAKYFCIWLFFWFEASFIPLAARQVLLCLACLLSPARLEHITASSSHSSTSSFEHCLNSFVNFLIFQFFFNSIILSILFSTSNSSTSSSKQSSSSFVIFSMFFFPPIYWQTRPSTVQILLSKTSYSSSVFKKVPYLSLTMIEKLKCSNWGGPGKRTPCKKSFFHQKMDVD